MYKAMADTMPDKFDFSTALTFLKQGQRLMRTSWKNAKFVFLTDGSKFQVNRAPLNKFFHDGTEVEYRPHIDLVASDGTVGVWSMGSVDVLAEDWKTYVDAGASNPGVQEESALPSAEDDETPQDPEDDGGVKPE